MDDFMKGGLSVHAEAVMPLINEKLTAGQTVRNLSFRGTSMLPMLRQGKDYVELTGLPERLKKYDLPLYRNAKGQYVLHRIVDVQGDCYVCRGDNTFHDETVAAQRMVGVVCAFTRAGRRISVDNRWYRLYCRVWCAAFPARRFVKRIEWRMRKAVNELVKR